MFNLKGYFQGALLNVIKDAFIKKVANEEERDSLVTNVVKKGTEALDNKYKISQTKFGTALSNKGFTKDRVDSIASTVADVAVGLASTFIINKLSQIDAKRILSEQESNSKNDNLKHDGSKDDK